MVKESMMTIESYTRVYLDKELILNHYVNCEHFISLQRVIVIKLTKLIGEGSKRRYEHP